MELKERIAQFIEENRDENKLQFDETLITTNYELKGIPVKPLEEFSTTLVKEGVNFDELLSPSCHDEILLAGMVLAKMKCDSKTKIRYLKKLLPFIDNWCTCDMIAIRLKGLGDKRDFFIELLHSKNAFQIRFGIVWFMKFELKKDLRGTVNLLNDNVKNTSYYVEMALAWCYAEAMLKDFDYMVEFIQTIKRYVVRNRTLQKMNESTRISKEQRAQIKALRSRLLGMEL